MKKYRPNETNKRRLISTIEQFKKSSQNVQNWDKYRIQSEKEAELNHDSQKPLDSKRMLDQRLSMTTDCVNNAISILHNKRDKLKIGIDNLKN
jgi:hypothetical protein